MKNIDFKAFFKKNWVHFLALGIFLSVTFVYFAPQFKGYGLKQHDIEQFKGMSHEIAEHRELYGEEPLWTNSMFGGMPTYQISTKYDGNWIAKIPSLLNFGMKSPAGIFILYLIGFYIMLMCMKVNKWVAIFGALAFAFASYNLIILQAGHNSKAMALALAPPVIGAFYLIYRSSLKWGLLLSALFMSIEIGANHLQVTYYLGFLLVFLGIVEFTRVLTKNTSFKQFGLATGGLILAYLFAVGINYGNISLTNDYAKYTIRGANDIKVNPDGTTAEKNQSAGLDKDYITQWSYGIGETFTLAAPYAKGGGSKAIGDGPFKEKLTESEYRRDKDVLANSNLYWGNQPITTGPVYIGIIVLLLAFLSLFVVKDKIKWALLGATILCVMLSWGKNYMGLTEFFIDNVPGYNKFRAVTIILVISEITLVLLGVLLLNYVIKNKDEIQKQIKTIAIAGGAFLLFILSVGLIGLGDNYLSEQEQDENYPIMMAQRTANQYFQQLPPERIGQIFGENPQDPNFQNNILAKLAQQTEDSLAITQTFRSDVFQSTFTTAFIFGLLALALLLLFAKYRFRVELLVIGLSVLTVVDLALVDVNYLSNKKDEKSRKYTFWVDSVEKDYPMQANAADNQILQQEMAANPELAEKINVAAQKIKKSARTQYKKGISRVIDAKRFATLNMNTHYRVFEPRSGFSSSRSAYFHKSINGYHGAKLRNIQNLQDFQFALGNYKTFDMLNVKYFINPNRQTGALEAQMNPNAMGNAWFVEELQVAETPEKEIRALGKEVKLSNTGLGKLMVNELEVKTALAYGLENITYILNTDTFTVNLQQTFRTDRASSYVTDVNGNTNWVPNTTLEADTSNSFNILIRTEITNNFSPEKEAIVSPAVAEKINKSTFSGEGEIKLSNYKPNHLEYVVSDVKEEQLAVFSEVYFKDGWNGYVDGQPAEVFKINYLLRGIKIPAGAQKVEMKFEVPKFKSVNTVAFVMGLALFISFLFFGYVDLKKRKNSKIS